MRPLGDAISILVKQQNHSWDKLLPSIALAFRTAVHTSTNETPFFLVYGRDAVLPQDCGLIPGTSPYNIDNQRLNVFFSAHKRAQDHLRNTQMKMAQNYNRKQRPHDIIVGDLVLLKLPPGQATNKLMFKWTEPHRVVHAHGNKVNFTIRNLNTGEQQKVHVSRIVKFKTWSNEATGLTENNNPADQPDDISDNDMATLYGDTSETEDLDVEMEHSESEKEGSESDIVSDESDYQGDSEWEP
eukprot:Selendium_serpulae@DN2054_c0_g1_i1.p1